MDVSIDRFADVARIRFGAETEGERVSREVAPGVRLEIDEKGDAIAIEVFGLSMRGIDPRDVSISVTTPFDVEPLPRGHPAHKAFSN